MVLETFAVLLLVVGVLGIYLHQNGKLGPLLDRLKTAFDNLNAGPSQSAVLAAFANDQANLNIDGNVPVLLDEIRSSPSSVDQHQFPATAVAPTTRFEEFNRRLLILEAGDQPQPWPLSRPNDYPTTLHGSLEWALPEIKRRLRPHYPVVLDTLGAWAEASEKLEINPDYVDMVVAAYLGLEEARRPVVVSVRGGQKSAGRPSMTLLRYGFADYVFETRFLNTHSVDLLHLLLRYFTDTPDTWRSFSPARLRKAIFDKHRVVSEQRQKLQAELTRSSEKNRFAQLWRLQDEPAVIEGEVTKPATASSGGGKV